MGESEWSQTHIFLVALASRLENEGQYNIAKLTRAAADSLSRRAAYQLDMPGGKAELAAQIEQAASALSALGVTAEISSTLRQGASALSENRLPLIYETPHPYVCRTCGHLALGELAEKCPVCGAWSATFQWFPPVYWLEAFDPPAALARLRQTPLEVAGLLSGLSEEQLSQTPEDGGWALRNIVSHLRDAQGVLSFRLDLFLNEEDPALESKAVFEWATREEARAPSTLEIFDSYKALRAETLAKLEVMPCDMWWRTGRHEEFGRISLRQQVSYFAAHELTHFPQIEKLRDHFTDDMVQTEESR
ncbi:MAG: DinB family protein [Anaerolineales bacterium]|nr:DinB family protein [Anaerolineales bacterium]